MSRQEVPVSSRALFLPNVIIWGMFPDRPQLRLERQLTSRIRAPLISYIWIEVIVFPDSDIWLSSLSPASHLELALVSLLLKCHTRGL